MLVMTAMTEESVIQSFDENRRKSNDKRGEVIQMRHSKQE